MQDHFLSCFLLVLVPFPSTYTIRMQKLVSAIFSNMMPCVTIVAAATYVLPAAFGEWGGFGADEAVERTRFGGETAVGTDDGVGPEGVVEGDSFSGGESVEAGGGVGLGAGDGEVTMDKRVKGVPGGLKTLIIESTVMSMSGRQRCKNR
ncbi:hypothetical protein L1987_78213 [Smallanthus sonchifolius]|uniref:Uncharacterized protein n=1 Tax=Smallanthus sonchifolius TaxID=185202 RepID=A0ACB8ZCJ3_9ASTR|nr:hypothetical protein L1987_78213 [Smallanthus sonchifolius]